MNLIVAVDRNWGIGYEGELLTRIPEDMKQFKKKTVGQVVVMGRTTYESLPNGKPLIDRDNIVLSRNDLYTSEGIRLVHSITQLLSVLPEYKDKQIFIIGGESIYHSLLPYCQYAYVTQIDTAFKADRHIMNLDELENWTLISKSERMTYQSLDFYYTVYENSKIQSM